MGTDDLADLDATLLIFCHILGYLTRADDVAVAQLDDVAVGVHFPDEQALVRLDAAGNVVQVHTLTQALHLPFDALGGLHLQLDPGLREVRALADLQPVNVEVGGAASEVLDRDTTHGNLLHQLLVVCVDRVETVHLGALDLVGRRVAQSEQRVEQAERLQRLRGLLRVTLDPLRLVDDQNRTVRRDHVDRLARLEVVEHLVDAAGILAGGVERLDIDDHHLHARVGREPLQLVQPRRVVDERARLGAIELLEVLSGDVKRLLHTLADRDRRHDHDVLRPPVPLVQLHDRLDVDVGLTSASFHLDIEVDWRGGLLDRILQIL